jgi:hypothetical protein
LVVRTAESRGLQKTGNNKEEQLKPVLKGKTNIILHDETHRSSPTWALSGYPIIRSLKINVRVSL